MSALAAIFNFNNVPLREEQREQLQLVWKSLEERGPDAGETLVQGPIGMCYRAFHTNRESRIEKQPLVGADNRVLIGDLRLDNRDELISKLRGLLHRRPSGITDIELVMAAYQRWGDVFPLHLVGEFALVLYDPINRKVVLARDHIGVRTLYYHFNANRLICSTELDPLLNIAGTPLEVNDEFVAGYLIYNPEPELTAYKHIHSVKPFHVLTFECDGRMSEKRYWDLSSVSPIRYKNDEEYQDEFNFHFGNAVRGPLRTDRPAFADLSGGLDSSSIVCVAHQAIQRGEVEAPELITVSLVSSGSPSSDQRKYIRYVEEHIGQSSHYIDEAHYPLLSSFQEAFGSALNPLRFSAAKHGRISELMKEAGARVLMGGTGGDEITCGYTNPGPGLADLMVTLRLLKLHDSLKLWSRKEKTPYLVLLSQATVSLLPRRLQVKYRLRRLPKISNVLDQRFVKRLSLMERLTPNTPFPCKLPSARDQSLGFWTAVRGIAPGYRRQATYGDVSYPFLARPLVEYMQAIPHDKVTQPGLGRFLMRRALKGVLPPKILNRRGKGDPEEVLARAFIREWSNLRPFLTNAHICSQGYTDKETFRAAVENYTAGQGADVGILLKLLSLEVWLRGLERHAVARSSSSFAAPRQTELQHATLEALVN